MQDDSSFLPLHRSIRKQDRNYWDLSPSIPFIPISYDNAQLILNAKSTNEDTKSTTLQPKFIQNPSPPTTSSKNPTSSPLSRRKPQNPLHPSCPPTPHQPPTEFSGPETILSTKLVELHFKTPPDYQIIIMFFKEVKPQGLRGGR